MSVLEPELHPATTFWENVAAGQLTFQRCVQCDGVVFYPRVVCPLCGGVELRWEQSIGAGTIYSVSSVPRRGQQPIVLCLVDLDEGFRMMSVMADDAGAAVIGQRVQAQFDPDNVPQRVVFTAGGTHA